MAEINNNREYQDKIVEHRERLKSEYGHLYDDVLNILQEHDPIGIAFVPDEYEPEVDTILPRLKEAHSVDELRRIIYEEFVRWFSSSDARSWEERLADNSAGPEERYAGIARSVWEAWQAWTAESSEV